MITPLGEWARRRLSLTTTRRNVLANFLGRAVGAAAVYVFVPLYLRFLGAEAFGVIGLFAVLQTLFAFADIGLTPTLSREMARLSARGGAAQEMHDLLHTVERPYWIIALLLAVLLALMANLVADGWLNAHHVEHATLVHAVSLMGLALGLQLPASLYQGGLLGLQRQVLSNALQIGWSLSRGIGAVLVLWLLSPTIEAFFVWHVIVNAAYLVVVRHMLKTALPGQTAPARFRPAMLRTLWRYAAGMAGMALLSAALTQMDRVVISKLLPLEEFGYYMLASALGQIPVLLVGPVGSAVFPRLTALATIGDRSTLSQVYHRACQVASVVAIPAGLVLGLFSFEIARLWTGSAETAARLAGSTTMLSLGSTFLALQVIPYNLALANAWTSLNLAISVVSAIIILPLLIFLVKALGMIGGGVAWLCLNVAVTPPFIHYLHRRVLPGETARWWMRDVGMPFLGAVICVMIGRLLFPAHSSSVTIIFGVGGVSLLAVLAAAFSVPRLTEFLLNRDSAVKHSDGTV